MALLSIFYGGISILAVIGNTLVIWVVATTRQMRTVTNMYIANLAFADVIIGLFSIPFQVSGCKCCKMHFVNELVDSHIFMFSNYVNVEKRAKRPFPFPFPCLHWLPKHLH